MGPGQTLGEAFAEAMRAYEEGRAADARRMARRLAETAPQFGGVHYLLGLLALDAGQGRRATESLACAIAITPGQPPLHLAMGRALELAGNPAEACQHYRQVLDRMPDHADAHARLGILSRRFGKPGEALDHCRRAITADPGHAEAWNALGGLLHEAGRPGEAADAFRKALDLRPDWPAALSNYGIALRGLGQLDLALTVLRGAVDIKPEHAPYRANLSSVLRAMRRFQDAAREAEKATRLAPRDADAWLELGLVRQESGHWEGAAAAYERATGIATGQPRLWYCLAEARRALGQADRAAKAYATCLELDPEDRFGAALGLALAGAATAPDKAPEAYVRQLFDDYAERFDTTLVDRLEYRAPALLRDALTRVLGEAAGLDVLDAGCGTGLAAEVLRPLARRLDGVDLSPQMVAKAQARGLYDSVEEGEVVRALAARPGAYDLIVAADVLVYLGDLEPFLRAAAAALKPAGCLAFTVERSDDGESYVLGAKHRYAHAEPYVRRLAGTYGFDVAILEDAVTRRDGGADVPGMVAVLGK